jgi:hypothetical protein
VYDDHIAAEGRRDLDRLPVSAARKGDNLRLQGARVEVDERTVQRLRAGELPQRLGPTPRLRQVVALPDSGRDEIG